MSRYQALYWWSEEDRAYVAEVPDLPGCMADGETPEELRRNLRTVIRQWIQTARSLGRAIPPPRTFETAEIETEDEKIPA
jgi:predicted RNase H-like HicB family nuclease